MSEEGKIAVAAHLCLNLLDAFLIWLLFHPSKIESIHISFDDVYESFRQANNPGCNSIFEVPFFSSLKKLNRDFDAKVSVYLFEDEKLIISSSIMQELKQCKKWLSIGYHARLDGKIDSQSYHRFNMKFYDSGLLSTRCRLHGFAGDDSVIAEMKAAGVKELFCADDGRTSYGVSSALYSGGYQQKERLVIFAHERPFQQYSEIKKLEAILRRLPADIKFDN